MKKKRNQLKLILILLLVAVFGLVLIQIATAETTITLDKKGRAGCLACHADPKIFRVEKGKKESLYIDPDRYYNSIHKNRACLDCHTDWEFRTHKVGGGDFKKTAGLACIRCHKHEKAFKEYKDSVHYKIITGSIEPSGKEAKGKDAPTCGSCHTALEPRGIHYIQKYPKSKNWRDSEYWTEFRYSADKVCGQCHMDRYKSYNDYYHGRAYKTREVDSPACWTCHNNHDIRPKADAVSTMNEINLPAACGRCHPEPSDSFIRQYAEMIHGRDKLYKNNFVLQYLRSDGGADGGGGGPIKWAGSKIVAVYDTVSGWVKSIVQFFLPENLRPQEDKE